MKKIILLFILISSIILGNYSETYEKAKILKIERDISLNQNESEVLTRKDKVFLAIKTGDKKGKNIVIEVPVYEEDIYNLDLETGNNVLLNVVEMDGIIEYTIVDHEKSNSLILLVAIFVLLTVLIAGKNGVKGILALLATIILIFYIFLPLVLKGFSPLLLGLIISIFASLITVVSISGLTKKSLVALLGTVGGLASATLISMFFINNMHLSGFSSIEALYASNLLEAINMKQLVSAGIIFGSLGAIMDVSVSIAASLYEITEHNNAINPKRLYLSGMNIGRDIIGTMVNTLVLAYLGSSLVTIILFTIQSETFPIIRIINFELIVTEFLRAISGSIGIIFSIPLTSLIGAKILTRK